MEAKDFVDELVARARKAQEEYEKFSQEQADAIVRACAKAVYDNAEYLARLAVDETRMGVYEHKIQKNKGKAKVIWNSLTLQGVYGRKMYETWYKMITMVEGGLDMTPMITHRFNYRDFDKGFEAMNSGRSGKVVLDWTK